MDESCCTTGKIKKVTMHMNRRTLCPAFEIFFDEITVSYSNFNLNYVMKYLNHIPAKYTTLAAQLIVAASNAAAVAATMPPDADPTQTQVPSTIEETPTEIVEKESISSNKRSKIGSSLRSSDAEQDWSLSDFENEELEEESKVAENICNEQEDYAFEMLPPDDEELPNI